MLSTILDDVAEVPRRVGSQSGQPLNVFSVDVEEWFQVGAFENTLDRGDWNSLESRVEHQTEQVLDLLKRHSVSATFFCLGWVAERFPSLLRKIADNNHEIACHGMDHQRIFSMAPEQFSKDIQKAKSLLEEASGCEVVGYRAPSFSLTFEVWNFYSILDATGFHYSSSVVPAKTDHYGSEGVPRLPFYPLQNCDIIEVPMTVVRIPGRMLPASGGGYFRLLPQTLSHWLMNKALKQTGIGTIFYMHPWEIDPEQPYVASAPVLSRFRHYTGLKKMETKLDRLLQNGRFNRVDHFLATEFEQRQS